MENSKEPAFPVIQKTDATGLTKREYFAAMAMQGFCASGYGEFTDTHQKRIAELSIKQADEILTQLEKK